MERQRGEAALVRVCDRFAERQCAVQLGSVDDRGLVTDRARHADHTRDVQNKRLGLYPAVASVQHYELDAVTGSPNDLTEAIRIHEERAAVLSKETQPLCPHPMAAE